MQGLGFFQKLSLPLFHLENKYAMSQIVTFLSGVVMWKLLLFQCMALLLSTMCSAWMSSSKWACLYCFLWINCPFYVSTFFYLFLYSAVAQFWLSFCSELCILEGAWRKVVDRIQPFTVTKPKISETDQLNVQLFFSIFKLNWPECLWMNLPRHNYAEIKKCELIHVCSK